MIKVTDPYFMYMHEETRADKINQIILDFQRYKIMGYDINDYQLQRRIYESAGISPESITAGEKKRIVEKVMETKN